MIGILSVFAQLERETILERTRIGIQKRAEDGLWRGGGKIPFPYHYDKEKGILVPNPEEVAILHKMISMYISGMSFGKIGEIVGMDDKLVEQRVLSRTNLGIIPYKGKEFAGKHEAVVDEETYKKIIETHKLRSKSRTERHYLLSGKIYCAKCGAKYRYQQWGKRLICYCYSQQKSKPKYIKDPNCKNKRWDSFEIEDIVLENLFMMALDETMFKDNYQLTQVNIIKEYEDRLKKIDSQIANLLTFLADNISVEITKSKIKELEEERVIINEKLTLARENEEKQQSKLNLVKNLQSTWYEMTFQEKRIIIEHIIDKIIVNNNEIEIYYKIS